MTRRERFMGHLKLAAMQMPFFVIRCQGAKAGEEMPQSWHLVNQGPEGQRYIIPFMLLEGKLELAIQCAEKPEVLAQIQDGNWHVLSCDSKGDQTGRVFLGPAGEKSKAKHKPGDCVWMKADVALNKHRSNQARKTA